MPYDQYTLASLTTDIQSLIGDTAGVYWTPTEIKFAIWEFMREWSGMTGYWRQRVGLTVPTGVANPYVDISVQFPTLRPRTVTVDQLVQEIQFHICEPSNGISGVGMSQQFSIDSINAAVVRARNKWVLDTQLPIAIHQNFPVVPPDSSGRFMLPDNTLIVHRAYWTTAENVWTVLQRSDAFSEDSWVPDWTINPLNRPFCFSMATTRPTEIALYPTTFDSGTLEFLSIDSSQLSPLDTTTSLGVPDDYTPAIKYGAMGDLFSLDGETYDPLRSAYCIKRYDNFVDASKAQNTILRGHVNGIPAILGTMASLDSKDTYWRQRTGRPKYTAVTAEIVVFWPLAMAQYGGELDICTAAPIPLLPDDTINLSPSEVDVMTDFVQHYLSIKMGGSELQQTFPQFDSMQSAAALRNNLLNAEARYLTGLFRQPNLDLATTPDLVTLNA